MAFNILGGIDFVQQQGEQGRQRYADRLLGAAYAAPPEQRQSALAKLAGTDGRLAMDAGAAFQAQDDNAADRRNKLLTSRAGVMVAMPAEQRALMWPSVRADLVRNDPELAALPEQYDDAQFGPVIEKLAGNGGGAKIHSQRVLADGRILNTYADGRTEVTNHVADRQSWFANNEGVDPYIAREDGTITVVGPGGAKPQPSKVFPDALAAAGPDGQTDPDFAALPEAARTRAAELERQGLPYHIINGRLVEGYSAGAEGAPPTNVQTSNVTPPPQAAPAPAQGDISRVPINDLGGGAINPLRRPTKQAAGTTAPSGYRYMPDGSLSFIPGGPADPANKPQPQDKPMPVGALRLQLDASEALSVADGVDELLSGFERQIEEGVLDLGPVNNLTYQARNAANQSTPQSRAYGSFVAGLEKLRNDSLRLNKGVQTDGDAQRAWNELMANINDGKLVKQRLAEIRKINARGARLQQEKMDQIESNYRGKAAADSPEDDIDALVEEWGT
jgi:hypothetical protein